MRFLHRDRSKRVFEDPAQYKLLRARLLEIIDTEKDSLRFNRLGHKYQSKVEHFGAHASYDPEGVLLI